LEAQFTAAYMWTNI